MSHWRKHTLVLGIDLGSQLSSMAVIEYMEAIKSLYSEPPVAEVHSLPSVVTFHRHNRVFGAAAESSDYRNTARGFKRLHGRTLSDVQAEEESGLQQCQACWAPVMETSSPLPNSVGLRVAHEGRAVTFSVEQITAMLLEQLTEPTLYNKEADCVISVPGHFSDAARRSVMTAASMVAGLNCLALVNETTAVAAEYAWTTRFGLAGKRKRNVVVVDLGHSGYQVAAYSVDEEGVLRILASACDLEVSGKAFDEVLVSHFCQELKDKYKLSVKNSPRALARLTLQCEKLKCQMSSMSSDLPLDVKSLLDISDFRLGLGTLNGNPVVCFNQERFEKMCTSLLDKVDGLLRMVMEQAGLNALDDVHTVQVVGGASRMPAVRKRIAKVFGMDKLNIRNDGTIVAQGCAILCSVLEPTIPTWRKLDIYDLNTPYLVVPSAASSSMKSRSVSMKGIPLDKQLLDRFVEDEDKRIAKDKLVEYINMIRNAVDGPLQSFVGASEQTLLLQALVDAEKWIEEGRENEEDQGGGRIPLVTAGARVRHERLKLMALFKPIRERHEDTERISRALDNLHSMVEDYTARINGLGKTDMEERLNQAKEWLQEKRVQSLQDLTQEPGINRYDIRAYDLALKHYLSDQSPESAKNKVSKYIRETMLLVGNSGPLKSFAVEERRAALLKDLDDAMAWLDQEDRQPEVYEDKWNQLKTLVRLFQRSRDEAGEIMRRFARLCGEVRDQTNNVEAYRKYKKYDSQDVVEVLNRSEQDIYETRAWLEDQMDVMMKQDPTQERNIPEIESRWSKIDSSSSSLQPLFCVPQVTPIVEVQVQLSDLTPAELFYFH